MTDAELNRLEQLAESQDDTITVELIEELRQTKADLKRIEIEQMRLSWENRGLCERFGLIRKEATHGV